MKHADGIMVHSIFFFFFPFSLSLQFMAWVSDGQMW